jgi:hypothetical protein
MAIIRQGTFGAENRSVTRLDTIGGASPPTIASVAKNGAYGYQHTGGAFGRSFTAAAARSVCALRPGGVKALGRLPIVTVAIGYAPLCIMWEPEFGRLQLMAGFEESDTEYRYPVAPVSDALFIASPAAWKIAGIAVKIAEVDGDVSFYLNGQKLLTWTGDTRIYRADSVELLDTITGVYWFGDEWNVTHSDEYWPMGEWGVNTYVDDLVIESLTEGDIVDAEPPYRALLWAPVTANGSITQWTKVNADTNAAAVADSLPDDGDSYVTTGEAGKKDEYLIAAPSLAGYLPEVVTVIARGKRATTAEAQDVQLLVTAGGEQEAAPAQELDADWNEIEATFRAKPVTAAPWDGAAIGALRIGIQSE